MPVKLAACAISILVASAGFAQPGKKVPLNYAENVLSRYVSGSSGFRSSPMDGGRKLFKISKLHGLTFEAAHRKLKAAFVRTGWHEEKMAGPQGSIATWTSPDGRTYELSDAKVSAVAGLSLYSTVPKSMVLARRQQSKPVVRRRTGR